MDADAPREDSGLQPERTALAWGRTMVAMVITSALFLRWFPHYGWFAGVLVGLCLTVALGIYGGQRRRYVVHDVGIRGGRIHADAVAVLWVTGAVLALAVLGMYTIFFLQLPG